MSAWPPVQVTARQPCFVLWCLASCGFLFFFFFAFSCFLFASRSHQIIFILDACYSSSTTSSTSSEDVCASVVPCNQPAHTATSEPVRGHGFLTPPCVCLLYGTQTHPAIVFRHLWAIRDIPNRFLLSGQPVHFLLLAVHTVQ